MVEINEDEYLSHYGIIRRSGRYPWGSGGNAHGFLADLQGLRDTGMSDAKIAESIGMTTTELRARIAIARAEKKAADVAMAEKLKHVKQMSNQAIAERMGLPGESSVRALLAPGALDRANKLKATSDMLEEQVKKKTLIDVGEGVESQLGISKEHLRDSIALLETQDRAHLVTFNSPQVGNNQQTKYRVLAPINMTQKEVWLRRDDLKQIKLHSSDLGHTFDEFKEPISVHPDRIQVKYANEGGTKADGVIYVRPGVPDLSLGKAQYAQVRIKVGDGHYLKGMAVYKDDLPKGVDLVFNTNKDDTGNKLDAMKPLKLEDPDLPFGSVVSQMLDKPGQPDAKVISAMNKVNDESDWADWSKTISAQMLSKQNPKLVREQLDVTYDRRKAEYDEIMKLNNPTVRRKLLEEFADSTDSAAVHLKAAQLKRSSWHVILPVNSLKPNEIYAPNYKDGERVALIRYPHGGTFEIPELVVNNKNKEGRAAIGTRSADAVGIHHTVAERLSGADFDGDTVLVIPNDKRVNKIKSTEPLEQLRDFDPKRDYPHVEGMRVMTKAQTQSEMGKISNLITDMTIKEAPRSELARAVKHSMVVIDAEKHKLNYKLSEEQNGIKALKEKYQTGGASTLISRAKADIYIDKRKPRLHALGGPVDPVTGERKYQPTGEMRVDKKGNLVPKKQKVSKLAEERDAFDLVSAPNGTPVERMYAEHSNKLKALANQARLDAIKTPHPKRSPSAARIYKDEVTTLNAKLKEYRDNKPLERQAQIVANTILKERLRANPGLDASTRKKVAHQALRRARANLKVKRIEIDITDKEWEAIQAGAVSNAKLSEILRRANPDRIRQLATPKSHLVMNEASIARANRMLEQGYTRDEVATQLGVSLSTLDRSTKGEGAYE